MKNKEEETLLQYASRLKKLTFDRTKSGNTEFNKFFLSVENVNVSLHNGTLKLKVPVDRRIVEVFINDGETTLTDLVFPVKMGVISSFFLKAVRDYLSL